MNAQNNLDFISTKINELGTAVLRDHSNSILHLNSTIIHTHCLDNTGSIWFYTSKPAQFIREFDPRFPVTLDYYKKGTPFTVSVYGVARIIHDPEELICTSIEPGKMMYIPKDQILICVRIGYASYQELAPQGEQGWLAKCKSAIKNMLHLHGNGTYTPHVLSDRQYA